MSIIDAIVRKVSNVARGLKQGYGTEATKKRLWDSEYSRGRWDFLDRMPGDCVFPYVERYANQGSILDLGCGPGTTSLELKSDKYERYTGIDISAVAVDRAAKRARQAGRAGKNSYSQAEILRYVPDRQYDVILFGDSLPYIPTGQIPALLNRYAAFLTPSGVFISRINGRPYLPKMEVIDRHFEVIERQVFDQEIFVLYSGQRALNRCPPRLSRLFLFQ